MPYLTVTDPDDFQHLLQLFYAAHPVWQERLASVRTQTETPTQLWCSAEVLRELIPWARRRFLITREGADRLSAAAAAMAKLAPRCYDGDLEGMWRGYLAAHPAMETPFLEEAGVQWVRTDLVRESARWARTHGFISAEFATVIETLCRQMTDAIHNAEQRGDF